MAEAADQTVFTVRYDGQTVALRVSKSSKVGEAVREAARRLKVEPHGLTVLHQGLEVPDDRIVEDLSCAVTVIHLLRRTNHSLRSGMVQPGSLQRQTLYAYCKECDGLVVARPILECRKCGEGGFMRTSSTPLDYQSCIAPDLLVGSCNNCNRDDLQPVVMFECHSCPGQTKSVALLRMVRKNVLSLPCMVCAKQLEQVIRFQCGHCMCFSCFGNMCRQLLPLDGFSLSEEVGYSISCPGPGEECKQAFAQDPHHYYIVGKDFYKEYQDKSMKMFQPPGDNILCQCKVEIDLSGGEKVEEEVPAVTNVSGQSWFLRLFQRKKPPPPPRVRKRATCRQCALQFCVGCKQLWHSGDCVPITPAIREAERAFPINPRRAEQSLWPQDST